MAALQLKLRLRGVAYGNFSPPAGDAAEDRERFATDVARALPRRSHVTTTPPSVRLIFAPRTEFTNCVVKLGTDDDSWSAFLVRTKEPADGGIVEGLNKGVALFSGDCPSVCLYQEDRLAVLHAGFRCMVRESPGEPNIIDAAFATGLFDASRAGVWIEAGIGPCCWHDERLPEMREERAELSRYYGVATRGPHAGTRARTIDLLQLIHDYVRNTCHVPAIHIEWDARCTACSSDQGRCDYWSHTRARHEGSTDGRNMFLAWLEEEPKT